MKKDIDKRESALKKISGLAQDIGNSKFNDTKGRYVEYLLNNIENRYCYGDFSGIEEIINNGIQDNGVNYELILSKLEKKYPTDNRWKEIINNYGKIEKDLLKEYNKLPKKYKEYYNKKSKKIEENVLSQDNYCNSKYLKKCRILFEKDIIITLIKIIIENREESIRDRLNELFNNRPYLELNKEAIYEIIDEIKNI